MPLGPLEPDDGLPITSTWRRRGGYIYQLAVYAVPLGRVGQWYARLASLGHLEPARSGQPVPIALTLPDAYGASPDEACARLEAAIAAWVKAQPERPDAEARSAPAVVTTTRMTRRHRNGLHDADPLRAR